MCIRDSGYTQYNSVTFQGGAAGTVTAGTNAGTFTGTAAGTVR